MKTVITIIFLFIVLRCKEEHTKKISYTEIQLSYSNGWDISSSLKVTKMDSVFIRDNTTGTCLIGKLGRQDKSTLDSFLSQVNLLKLDSDYNPIGYSMNDCSTFRLFFKMGNRQKTITSKCVAPEQLKLFKNWLVQISRSAKTPDDCTANFDETDKGYCCY